MEAAEYVSPAPAFIFSPVYRTHAVEPVTCVCARAATQAQHGTHPYRTLAASVQPKSQIQHRGLLVPFTPPLRLHSGASIFNGRTAAYFSAPDPTFDFDSPYPVAWVPSLPPRLPFDCTTRGRFDQQREDQDVLVVKFCSIYFAGRLGRVSNGPGTIHIDLTTVLDNEHLYLLLDRDRFDPFCSLNFSIVDL